MQHNLAITSGRQEEDIEKELENYFAVDYVDRFYISRVILAVDEGFWMVKSLYQYSRVFYIFLARVT